MRVIDKANEPGRNGVVVDELLETYRCIRLASSFEQVKSPASLVVRSDALTSWPEEP